MQAAIMVPGADGGIRDIRDVQRPIGHHPADCPTCFGAVAEERDWRILQSWRLTPRLTLGPDGEEGRAAGDADLGGLANGITGAGPITAPGAGRVRPRSVIVPGVAKVRDVGAYRVTGEKTDNEVETGRTNDKRNLLI
jgi:hypothetical protein